MPKPLLDFILDYVIFKELRRGDEHTADTVLLIFA